MMGSGHSLYKTLMNKTEFFSYLYSSWFAFSTLEGYKVAVFSVFQLENPLSTYEKITIIDLFSEDYTQFAKHWFPFWTCMGIVEWAGAILCLNLSSFLAYKASILVSSATGMRCSKVRTYRYDHLDQLVTGLLSNFILTNSFKNWRPHQVADPKNVESLEGSTSQALDQEFMPCPSHQTLFG